MRTRNPKEAGPGDGQLWRSLTDRFGSIRAGLGVGKQLFAAQALAGRALRSAVHRIAHIQAAYFPRGERQLEAGYPKHARIRRPSTTAAQLSPAARADCQRNCRAHAALPARTSLVHAPKLPESSLLGPCRRRVSCPPRLTPCDLSPEAAHQLIQGLAFEKARA